MSGILKTKKVFDYNFNKKKNYLNSYNPEHYFLLILKNQCDFNILLLNFFFTTKKIQMKTREELPYYEILIINVVRN